MAGGGNLRTELIARALIAAARAYGDDPVLAMTTASKPLRRARSAAAAGLHDALKTTVMEAAAMTGVAFKTLGLLIRSGDGRFQAARAAARDVVRARIEALPRLPDLPIDDRPKPNMPAPCVVSRDRPLPPAPEVTALPANRASRTVGKPAARKVDVREAEIGLSPADTSGHGYERRFVSERRENHVPWAHIAKQLGGRKTADDLRRLYDPSFDRAAVASVLDAARVKVGSGLTATQRSLLRILDGKTRVLDAAQRAGCELSYASRLCNGLAEQGLLRKGAHLMWRRTEAGAAALEAIGG